MACWCPMHLREQHSHTPTEAAEGTEVTEPSANVVVLSHPSASNCASCSTAQTPKQPVLSACTAPLHLLKCICLSRGGDNAWWHKMQNRVEPQGPLLTLKSAVGCVNALWVQHGTPALIAGMGSFRIYQPWHQSMASSSAWGQQLAQPDTKNTPLPPLLTCQTGATISARGRKCKPEGMCMVHRQIQQPTYNLSASSTYLHGLCQRST